MVVAPRYTPAPVADIAVAPAPRPGTDPVAVTPADEDPRDLFGPVATDGGRHNLLSLKVELDAGLPLASLRSLYHPVVIESTQDGRQIIALSRSEEHTSELQSLMRISYAVFCLKKKKKKKKETK